MSTTHLQRLALDLMAHFDREAAALEQVVTSLEELRQALLESSFALVEAAQARQAALLDQLESLRTARAAHVQAAAAALGMPAEGFRIRDLEARVPRNLSRQLELARERTRGLAQDADALSRRNSALARHCLAFVRERLDAMSCVIFIGRYTASGKAVEPPRTSIIAVQG